MFKKILILLFILSSNAYAQTGTTAPMFGLDQCLWFEDSDASVINNYCAKMIVPDGSFTDNGNGSFTLTMTGGSGSGDDSVVSLKIGGTLEQTGTFTMDFDGAQFQSTESPTDEENISIRDIYVKTVGDTMSGNLFVPNQAYNGTTWNGNLSVPTKDAIRDKIETLGTGDVEAVGDCGGPLCFEGTSGTTLTFQLTGDSIDGLEDNTLTFKNNDSNNVTIIGRNFDGSPTDTTYTTYEKGRVFIGGTDVTRIALATDGTGTDEVVVPEGSIDTDEILNGTIIVDDHAATGTPSSTTFWRGDDTWSIPTNASYVVGPASSTDNAVARFDGTTGKIIQNSGVTIADNNHITTTGSISLNGTLDVGGPTTAVNNADAVIGVSAANQIGLVVQTKATPTKPAFEIQTSAGRPAVRFETAGNSNLRINYSGTMADAGFAGFGLSVQNINDAGEGSWIEILNSGGANTGAFFGMFGNQFQLFNWQGGDIEFWTFPTASNGYPRVTISDTGNMGLDGAPQFGWGHGWGGGVGVFALANVSTAPTTSLTTALAMYSKSQELYYMGPSNQERKVAYHAPTMSIPINPGSMILTGTLAITGDATQGAQIDGYNSYVLLFDATTDEGAAYRFKLPSNWSAHSSLRLNYSMTSATANEVEWEAAVMCITPTTDSIRDDADSFAAFATAVDTVRATARYEDTVSITLTDDSCAAGDDMVINISTDSDDATNDDATGDRRLIGATYIYTVF